MRFLLLLFFCGLLCGCTTTPQMTRDQFLQTTQRVYSGVDKEQILKNAEEIFRLSDGSDYSFSYRENGLQAIRFYNVYMVLSVVSGNFVWNVDTEDLPGGTLVKIHAEDRRGGFLSPTYTYPINTLDSYDFFWRRLDFLLGKSDKWISCQVARNEHMENSNVWCNLEPWCFVTDDKNPPGVNDEAINRVALKKEE